MREHDNSAASIANPIARKDQHALQTSMALFASPALREYLISVASIAIPIAHTDQHALQTSKAVLSICLLRSPTPLH